MKTMVLALFSIFLAAPVLAADNTASPGQQASNPMQGWVPRKVTNEAQDKQEIQAFFQTWESAGRSGNAEAAAGLIDFPILMATDDSKGEAKTDFWTRDQWMRVMAPFYKPHPDMKMTHKPTIYMLTDSLATVDDQWTMSMNGNTYTGRSSMLLVRKGGKWLSKSMVEGGWGDAMGQNQAAAGQPGAPASGTGSTGTMPQNEQPQSPQQPAK